MDIDHALEIADEWRAGRYYSITHQALYEMADAIRYAKAGVEVVDAQLAMKDAWRYRELRRGQHWSVIDGIGNTLRADDLDAAIDAAMLKASNVEASGGPSAESRKSAMAVRR